MTRYAFRELVIDSRTGLNPRKNFTLGNGSNYYITIKDIHDGEIVITDKTDRVDDDAITIIKKRSRIKNGDVLFTSIGRIGETAIVTNKDDSWDVNESVFVFTLNTGIITQEYFCALFQSKAVQEMLARDSSGSTFKSIKMNQLEKMSFDIPDIDEQKIVVKTLGEVNSLLSSRKQQLAKLDELVKARFVELFGDPITNSSNLPTEKMELRFNLKAGITTAADDIHAFEEGAYEIPCYGGNGIRGYVREKSYTGNYPIIGRQGALCGNVQYATGDFHATEHAVLVSLLKDDNAIWVYHMLKLMDLYRYHTGAAQPGLAVKTLNTVEVIVADKSKQDQFAAFVEQTDQSKLAIQQSLDKLETLKKSLMQKYFG